MKKILLAVIAISSFAITHAQTWITLNSGSTSNLKAIHFPTANVGYAVGFSGTILKTLNGGSNWQSTTSNFAGYLFWDCHFVSADTGFVVGESDPGSNPCGQGIILKTTNGGNTWIACVSGAANPFRDLFVLNKDTIFAAGGAEQTDGKIMKSVNGGTSWTQIGLTYYDAMLGGLYFKNSNVGFLGVYESVFGTYNPTNAAWLNTTNGTTFTATICSPHGYWNFSTDFGQPNTGYSTRATYVAGDTVYLRKTTNGGTTWTENPIPNFVAGLTGVGLDFIDANIGYICGGDGMIMKTTDGGASWYLQTTGTFSELRSIYFVNGLLGFAAGDNGTILKWSTASGIFETSGTSSNQLIVYPNPTTGYFQINNLEPSCKIEIYNAEGLKLLSKTNSEDNALIDLTPYSSGLYSIVVIGNKGVYSSKILKQ